MLVVSLVDVLVVSLVVVELLMSELEPVLSLIPVSSIPSSTMISYSVTALPTAIRKVVEPAACGVKMAARELPTGETVAIFGSEISQA